MIEVMCIITGIVWFLAAKHVSPSSMNRYSSFTPFVQKKIFSVLSGVKGQTYSMNVFMYAISFTIMTTLMLLIFT